MRTLKPPILKLTGHQRFLVIEPLRRDVPSDERMRELRSIADKIFRNRNLQQVKSWEMLKDEWPEIKTAVWPMLRATIHTARMAREALRDGDIDKLNTLTDRTRLYHAYSEMELLWFGARVADRRHEAPRKIFRLGGDATAEKYEVPGLKGAIRLWLDNGRPLRGQAKRWAREYNVAQSRIYRNISAVLLEPEYKKYKPPLKKNAKGARK